MKRQVSLIATLFATFMFVTADSSGYVTWECLGEKLKWDSNSVRMRASGVSFPSGSSYRTALGTVISRLNRNPSKFNFNLTYDEPGVGRGNGENEIWFSSDPDALDGAPAITWLWYDCVDYWIFGTDVEITETDVVFDVNLTWTSGTSKSVMTSYGGSARPFRTAAMHELGHALGLAHESGEYNIMGQDWDHIHANGSTARSYLGEDASDGAVYLYGSDSSAGEDLGVVHWRHTGSSGEYSTHGRTRIFNSSGVELSSFTSGGQPVYRVDNGQTIQVEFSYENNGLNRQNPVSIGFYLSTNDYITTWDDYLGGFSADLGRNQVWTTSRTITLPSNLASNGDYYIGAIIDNNDAISEFDESNNATYTRIRVNPYTPTPTPTPTQITFPVFTPILTLIPLATPTPTPWIFPILTPFPVFTLAPLGTPTPTPFFFPITPLPIELIPTPTPFLVPFTPIPASLMPTPIPMGAAPPTPDPETYGCVQASDIYPREVTNVSMVNLGWVAFTEGYLPDGTPAPLSVVDCSGDGNLDVFIPWSEATGTQLAAIHLSPNLCQGKAPQIVDVLLTHGYRCTLYALDDTGTIVDVQNVATPDLVQNVRLASTRGIRTIQVEGAEICILRVCWRCQAVERTPQPTPTATPTPSIGPPPPKDCVEPGDVFTTEVRSVPAVDLGPVGFVQGALADGTPVPLSVVDCSGDGRLDVWIPWSEASASAKAMMYLSPDLCEGKPPEEVQVVLTTGNYCILYAYDEAGNLVDKATAAATAGVQTLTLSSASGIRWVEIEGSEICILQICWTCPAIERTPVPTQTPRATPTLGEAPTEGCVEAGDYYSSETGDVPTVNLGWVLFRQGALPDGTPVPLSVIDCSEDGKLDVWVPWTEASASQKATILMSPNLCGGNAPQVVEVILQHGFMCTLYAYDDSGALVATATAANVPTVQTLTLSSPTGIRLVEIEGAEICILRVCWRCKLPELTPKPSPTLPVRPTATPTSTPTATFTPVPTRPPVEENCVEPGQFFEKPQEGLLTVALGPVQVHAAKDAAGVDVPLDLRECWEPGMLGLWIPWTEASASQPATIVFPPELCDGAFPLGVEVVLVHYNSATLRAYDLTGALVDTAVAAPVSSVQSLNLFSASGIVKITIEGSEICLLRICWWCKAPPRPTPTWIPIDPDAKPGSPVKVTVVTTTSDRTVFRVKAPGYWLSRTVYAGREFARVEFPEVGVLDGEGFEPGNEWFQFPGDANHPPLSPARYRNALSVRILRPPFPRELGREGASALKTLPRTAAEMRELGIDPAGARPGIPILAGLVALNPASARENILAVTYSAKSQIVTLPAPLVPAGYTGLDQVDEEIASLQDFIPPELIDEQFYAEFRGLYSGPERTLSEISRRGIFAGAEVRCPLVTVLTPTIVEIPSVVEIEIIHPDGTVEKGPSDKSAVLGWDEWVHKPPFINGASVIESLLAQGIVIRPIRFAHYLILTPGTYRNLLDDFIDWKESKGLNVDVAIVGNEASADVAPDRAAIDTYIENYFNNLPGWVRTLYVLLVGDVDTVPSGRSTYASPTSADSDHVYEVLGTDTSATIYVGRLSCNSSAELENQLDKILTYEQGSPSGLWPRTVTLCANSETNTGCRGVCPDFPSKYAQAVNDIASYGSYTNPPTFEVFHAGASDDTTVRATNQDVIDAIDAGRGQVLYRGHGSTSSWLKGWDGSSDWGDSFDKNDEVLDLNNDAYPIVYSIACDNNDISVEDCVGEVWMSQEDAGAVAYWSASVPSWTTENHNRAKGIFRAIYESGFTRLGPALAEAERISSGLTGDTTSWNNNTFCYLLLGDPELTIRRYGILVAQFPSVLIESLAEGILVRVTGSEGEPVPGALLDFDLLEKPSVNGFTDENGELVLTDVSQDAIAVINVHAEGFPWGKIVLAKPTPTPTATPTVGPPAVEGCVEAGDVYTSEVRDVATVNLGWVQFTQGALANGTPVPLSVVDCSGDGALDVWVPWTESSASQKATILMSPNLCRGSAPQVVEVTLQHGFMCTLYAYDDSGALVDTATAANVPTVQTLTLFSPTGIRLIGIEGAEICILRVCWRCQAPEITPTPKPTIGPPGWFNVIEITCKEPLRYGGTFTFSLIPRGYACEYLVECGPLAFLSVEISCEQCVNVPCEESVECIIEQLVHGINLFGEGIWRAERVGPGQIRIEGPEPFDKCISGEVDPQSGMGLPLTSECAINNICNGIPGDEREPHVSGYSFNVIAEPGLTPVPTATPTETPVPTIYPDPIWVDVNDESGIDDGSELYPFNSIADAMVVAITHTIRVRSGTYVENVVMKDGVKLIGAGAQTTVIDGGGSGAGVLCTNVGPDSLVAGFTITNAGIGILCQSSSLMIRENVITGIDPSSTAGDGIRLTDSSPLIQNNVIYGVGGQGIVGTGNSEPRIINNTIYDCRYYAGISFASLDISAVSPVIKNNIVVRGNTEPVAGILWRSPATPDLSYNDVYDPADTTGVGSYYSYHDGTQWIESSGGPGAISEDPLFVDESTGDFYLQPESPCIDAGDPAPEYNDVDGSRNDMGAYGGQRLGVGGVVHRGSGFIFTSVGRIPVTEIVQNPADPSFGLAKVSATAASDYRIHRYTDAPFGGRLWIRGLFGASDDIDFYQLIATSEDGTERFALSDPLVKTHYIIESPTGTVKHTRVRLGPQTVGGVPNLYKLNKEGYWSQQDLRVIWNTTGLNGRYRLDYVAYQLAAPETIVQVTPAYNELDHITLWLDNSPLEVRINEVRYADNTGLDECEDILFPHGGSSELIFNITANHPNGFLRYYILDSYWGNNRFGGRFAYERYVGMHDSSPPSWTGPVDVSLPPLLPRDLDGDPMAWQNCAYRFRLVAGARTTDGFRYLRYRTYSVHHSVETVSPKMQAALKETPCLDCPQDDNAELSPQATLAPHVPIPPPVTISSADRSTRKSIAAAPTGPIWVDDDNTSGVEDGTAAHPYRTIGDGISAAAAGQVVRVMPGLYTESVTMADGVSVIGSGAASTVINPGGISGPAVSCVGVGAGTILSGFSITNAGTGIYCHSSSLVLRENIISNMDPSSLGADGIRLDDSSPLIANNVIYHVGGMGIRGQGNSEPRIINNTIYDYGYYAGISFSALNIGAVSPMIKNNIVVRGNDAPVGGILWSYPASALVSYNDVFDPANVTGGGSYYAYHDGTHWNEVSGGPGAISADPLFVDAGRGDFHLDPGSPCIDAGDPAAEYNDLDGSRNDMGAFGGQRLDVTAPTHTGSGFVFTSIGKVPITEIVSDESDPSHGLLRVSDAVAEDLHIHKFTDAAFGGVLWIRGLFGASDNVDYYQVLAAPYGSSATATLSDPLVKTRFTINPDGTVTRTRVQMGPQTVDGVDNLYLLNKEGYWTFTDLRFIWNTTGLNGKYNVAIKAFRQVGDNVVEVTLPRNELDHFTIQINNRPVQVRINSITYSDSTPIEECDKIIFPHLGDSSLIFNITAWHPDGLLRNFYLRSYWGNNRYGGEFIRDRYVGSHDTSPPTWYGLLNQDLPPLVPRDSSGAVMDWHTCPYRFRLVGSARITDGVKYLRWGTYNVHHSVVVTGPAPTATATFTPGAIEVPPTPLPLTPRPPTPVPSTPTPPRPTFTPTARPTPTPSVTPTPVPAAVRDWFILSQGHGGRMANKIVRDDLSRVTSFPGLPLRVALLMGSSTERSVNAAAADIDGDGVNDVTVGFGPGGRGSQSPSYVVAWTFDEVGRPRVLTARGVFAPNARNEILRNPDGAINVAAGYFVEGETTPLIIAAQGLGGSNHVRVLRYVEGVGGRRGRFEYVGLFQGLTGSAARYNASGGTSVAAGDLDGDGLDELVVGQMNGAETGFTTLIQILDLAMVDGKVIVERITPPVPAFPRALRGLGGVNLAVGDVDGDGMNELIAATAGGPAGGYVRVFDIVTNERLRVVGLRSLVPPRAMFGAAKNPSGGLDVAVANLDEDPALEVIVSVQALISLDRETGEVSLERVPPQALVKAVNLVFDADGEFVTVTDALPPFAGYGGRFAPTSMSVNLAVYPRRPVIVPPPIRTLIPVPTHTPTPTVTPTHTPTVYVQPTLGWIPFDGAASPGEPPRPAIKEETSTGLMINFDVPGMYAHEVKVNGVIYHRFSIPGEGVLTDVGKPELPILGCLVEIPYDVNLSVDIFKSESRSLPHYNVYPAQEPEVRLADIPKPTPGPFELDSSVYLTDAQYPGSLAGFDSKDVGVIRGHRVVFLKVNPVQYNPVTDEIEVFSKIEVRINYDRPGQIQRVDDRVDSPAFEKLLENTLINYKDVFRFPVLDVIEKERQGCDYLIITHSSFYNATDANNPIVRFRNWKQRKGFKTLVVETSNITNGNTANGIRTYIQNVYDTWYPVPTYILLVGDAEFIPTNYETQHPSHNNTDAGTDLYYVTVDGTDYFPDIFIGRLSVDTLTQLEDAIDRILEYERNAPADADFYQDTSLVCLFEDDGSGSASVDGREDPTFRIIEMAEAIRTYMQGQGYDCERIYDQSGNFPQGPLRYENNTAIPVELTIAGNPGAGIPGFPWNGNTNDITNAINNGNFLVTYDGHGNRTGWARPGFNNANVDALTNGALSPAVFCLACMNGWFDNETDAADLSPQPGIQGTGFNDESFCEHFLRDNNGGSVAIIGASRISWDQNDFMMLGMYKAIWPDFVPNPPISGTLPAIQMGPLVRMGQIHEFSKIYMANRYTHSTTRQLTFEIYHLFGDPEMPIWTTRPDTLDVEHPAGIGAAGQQDFVVKVTDESSGDPILGAMVVLTRGDSILAVRQTNAGGLARFTMSGPGAGDLDITVTVHNYRPYEGKIIVNAGGAVLNRLDPDNGIEGSTFFVGGQNFSGSENVDIFLGDQLMKTVTASGGSFGQSGVEDVDINVPSPYDLGPVNVVAHGKTSNRYAVDVFRVRTANPIDLYIYSQWDNTTWHLHSGNNPTWNNPEITLFDTGGSPVQSNNLTVGNTYTIKARIHNDTDFDASGVQVTFKWANFGAGQPDHVWNVIGTDTINVPKHNTADAEVNWAPGITGHLCLLAEIYHVEDINDSNNKGQENCHVGPTSSPATVPFLVWNPTDQPAMVFFEMRQLVAPGQEREERLWPTKLRQPDPQLIPPGDRAEAYVIIDPGVADVKLGEQAEFALTAFIGRRVIGGANFIIQNR